MLRPRGLRPGLSPVEVLVVSVLLVLLGSVLVVSLACSRDTTARGNQCRNNLKQLALAVHSYHSVYSKFPIGVRTSQGKDEAPLLGVSFYVGILPQIEQANLFDKWSFAGDWAHPIGPDGKTNLQRIDNLVPSVYRCPTSPVTETVTIEGSRVIVPSYVGISGATNDAASGVKKDGIDGYSDKREVRTKFGIISSSGMLIPNQAIRIDDVRDGTTNQLFFAEQSDLFTDAGGTRRNFQAGYAQGAFAGTNLGGTPPDAEWENASPKVYNLTTVRYAVNYKNGVPNDPAAGFSEEGPGHNAGIVSPHAGLAIVAVADGSVKSLSDGTDRLTLYRLSNRDDGGVIRPW